MPGYMPRTPSPASALPEEQSVARLTTLRLPAISNLAHEVAAEVAEKNALPCGPDNDLSMSSLANS